MKKAWITALAVGLMGAGLALAAEKSAAPKAETTLKGEVVDLSCYLAKGAKGKGHKACALKCIKGGSPAGLLTEDGSVYLVLENHEKPKALKELKDLAGEVVMASGQEVKQGGLQALLVTKVEKP